MAEDTIDAAILSHALPRLPCRTRDLKLTEHGALPPLSPLDESPKAELSPSIIESCFRDRYARNADDILARRTRVSMLDTQLAKDQGAIAESAIQKLRANNA